MQKKKVQKFKKVLLLGQLYDLDLSDTHDFEQSVQFDLKYRFGGVSVPPFTATMNGDTLTMKLLMTVEDVNNSDVYLNPDSDSIPQKVVRVIEGDQKHSIFQYFTPYGSDYANWTMCIEEFIDEYKKSSRANKASRFKNIDVKFSRVKGLTMALTF